MYACIKGQDRIVRILIDHGADPEVLDKVRIVYSNCCLLQMIYMHVHKLFHLMIQER